MVSDPGWNPRQGSLGQKEGSQSDGPASCVTLDQPGIFICKMSYDSACHQGLNGTKSVRRHWGTTSHGSDTSGCFHRYSHKVQRSELRAVQSPRGSELAHPFPSENSPVAGHSPVQQWDSVYCPEGKALLA